MMKPETEEWQTNLDKWREKRRIQVIRQAPLVENSQKDIENDYKKRIDDIRDNIKRIQKQRVSFSGLSVTTHDDEDGVQPKVFSKSVTNSPAVKSSIEIPFPEIKGNKNDSSVSHSVVVRKEGVATKYEEGDKLNNEEIKLKLSHEPDKIELDNDKVIHDLENRLKNTKKISESLTSNSEDDEEDLINESRRNREENGKFINIQLIRKPGSNNKEVNWGITLKSDSTDPALRGSLIRITHIKIGSSADLGELKKDDILISINGKKLLDSSNSFLSLREVEQILANSTASKELSLTIRRQNEDFEDEDLDSRSENTLLQESQPLHSPDMPEISPLPACENEMGTIQLNKAKEVLTESNDNSTDEEYTQENVQSKTESPKPQLNVVSQSHRDTNLCTKSEETIKNSCRISLPPQINRISTVISSFDGLERPPLKPHKKDLVNFPNKKPEKGKMGYESNERKLLVSSPLSTHDINNQRKSEKLMSISLQNENVSSPPLPPRTSPKKYDEFDSLKPYKKMSQSFQKEFYKTPPRPKRSTRKDAGLKICQACETELGIGDLMIIQSLDLYFHLDCFRCCSCYQMLCDGYSDCEVRIKRGNLYCNDCYVIINNVDKKFKKKIPDGENIKDHNDSAHENDIDPWGRSSSEYQSKDERSKVNPDKELYKYDLLQPYRRCSLPLNPITKLSDKTREYLSNISVHTRSFVGYF